MAVLYGQRPGLLSWAGSETLQLYINLRYGSQVKPISFTAGPSSLGGFELLTKSTDDTNPADLSAIKLFLPSIRMGYGHHRIARSIMTWAESKNPALIDLISLDSPQSGMIKDLEGLYSLFTRLSASIGGPMQMLLNAVLLRGNIDTLAASIAIAKHYSVLFSSLPKHIPCMASYPFAAQIAVAAGFEKVLNLIPDNHPQYYLLTPGSCNIVQTESAKQKFIKMGVSENEIESVGHFVPHDLAIHIEGDSQTRIDRRMRNAPLRCLLSLGGMGVQAGFFRRLIEKLLPMVNQGKLLLFINTGEHASFAASILSLLESTKVPFTEVDSAKGLDQFTKWHSIDSDEPSHSVTVFRFADYGLSLKASDELVRCADVLVSRPSQISYFPVPKVLLRRLADHESENSEYLVNLDETDPECNRPESAVITIERLIDDSSILIRRNEAIIKRASTGLYNGAKRALEIAEL